LLRDYDCEIRYHPGKVNVVADEERNKPLCVRALMMTVHNDLPKEIREAQEEAMKKENVKAKNLGKCLTYVKFKAEHQKPSRLLQQPKIPVWKWERITMDFVSGLPRTPSGYDTIWEVGCRHGVPVLLISDRDSHFTSRFWRSLQKALGTNLDMSTAYYPQMDGQTERTIQMLEDMLRACAAPYEALYRRKCRSPVCWSEVGDSQLTGPELIRNMTEKIIQIKNRLLTARSRQKSYTDRRTKSLEFEVGDMVLLKVSPWKGVLHFRKHGKLSPRYIGPFKILARVGHVPYTLELLEELKGTHSIFHVFNLKKCLAEGNIVVPMDEIQLDDVKLFALVDLIDLDLLLKIVMVNVIPPDHVDDVPVVEPNQLDDVPVVPELVDPLNSLPPAFESELEDVIEVENTIDSEDETVLVSVYEEGESSTAPFL
ncbi:putative reverse transcriptase domain-containing protein, partial [Tanacetum coccineum]